MLKKIFALFSVFIFSFSFSLSVYAFNYLDLIEGVFWVCTVGNEFHMNQKQSVLSDKEQFIQSVSDELSRSSDFDSSVSDGWIGVDSDYQFVSKTIFKNAEDVAGLSTYITTLFNYYNITVPEKYHYIASAFTNGSSDILVDVSVYYDFADNAVFSYSHTTGNYNATIKCDSSCKRLWGYYKRLTQNRITLENRASNSYNADSVFYRGGSGYTNYSELCYVTDFEPTSLYHWESTIQQDGNNVTTTISCILDQPDFYGPFPIGSYKCSSGIVYHDDENNVHGYPSEEYFMMNDVIVDDDPQNGVLYRETYTFNLKDLERVRKRKKLDLYNYFYIFNNVIDDNYQSVHYRQELVNWVDVDDGIFSDTEDIPTYQIPPLIDLPSILPYDFDYSPTSYTTINNYNGTDFDFESFFGWFESNFVAMANNMGAFFVNAQNFMAAFADFEVNGTLNAIANIGSLIDDLNLNLNAHFNNIGDYINNISNAFDTNLKILFDNINNEFNGSIGTVGKLTDAIDFNFDNITNSISSYIGDLISTINNNTETITDNIHDQLVPDYDNIKFILQYYTGWFYQVYNVFDNVSVTPAPISVHLPFVNRDLELVVPPSFQNLRDLVSTVLYAATAFTCFRLGFQIFGIHLSDDSGGD